MTISKQTDAWLNDEYEKALAQLEERDRIKSDEIDKLSAQLNEQGGIEKMAKLSSEERIESDLRRRFSDIIGVNERDIADNSNNPRELELVAALTILTEIRQRVAQNPHTSPETLDALAKDREVEVVLNVAYNPNTSNETFKLLAVDQNMHVREAVAYNASAANYHQQLLDYGLQHNTGILIQLALGSQDPSILKQLADSDNDSVMMGLARNKNTPYNILAKLAKTEDSAYDGHGSTIRNNVENNTSYTDAN